MAVEADRTGAGTSRRARATRTSGLRRARRRPRLLRGLRRGRADGPAAADLVDHPLAPLEDADPVPRAPLPGGHLRRARQRPLGPPAGARGVRRARVRRRRARGDGRDRHRARRARRRSRSARSAALLLAAEHPERVDGAVFIAPGRAARRRPCPSARRYSFDERARHRRGLGEVQPPLLARATTRTSSSSSSRRCFTEPHSTKPIEDCVGWGLETTPRR